MYGESVHKKQDAKGIGLEQRLIYSLIVWQYWFNMAAFRLRNIVICNMFNNEASNYQKGHTFEPKII